MLELWRRGYRVNVESFVCLVSPTGRAIFFLVCDPEPTPPPKNTEDEEHEDRWAKYQRAYDERRSYWIRLDTKLLVEMSPIAQRVSSPTQSHSGEFRHDWGSYRGKWRLFAGRRCMEQWQHLHRVCTGQQNRQLKLMFSTSEVHVRDRVLLHHIQQDDDFNNWL